MENKVISFFWGNKTMSWLRYMTLFSFRQYNPEWTMNLYIAEQKIDHKIWSTPETQDFFRYQGTNYFDLIDKLNINIKSYNIKTKTGNDISPSQQSNFFKWNLLATEGGFYSDMDILFVRDINDMFELSKQYDIGITFTSHFSIGFMFSNGNDNFFKQVYDECYANFDVNNYQGAGVIRLNSKYSHINKIQEKVYNIPFDYLYQYDSVNIPKVYEENGNYYLNRNSVGLHWYAGHEASQKINNTLNEKNYKDKNTLISRTLQKILKSEHINYSFLLPYYKRPQLKSSLFSFEHHYKNRNDYEIIIIEDSKNAESKPHHDELLNIIRMFSGSIKIIHVVDPIKSSSPVTKYNMGFKHTNGHFIILSNPEIFHETNILSGLDSEFSADENKYIVCACKSKIYTNPVFSEFKEYSGGKEEMWYQLSKSRNNKYHFCSAISKILYAKIGGFDERFSNGMAYEDDDFVNRIKANKIPIITKDNFITIHINHEHNYTGNTNINRTLYEKNKKTNDYFEQNSVRDMYKLYENNKNISPFIPLVVPSKPVSVTPGISPKTVRKEQTEYVHNLHPEITPRL